MKHRFIISLLALMAIGLWACDPQEAVLKITVANALDFERSEIVSVNRRDIAAFFADKDLANILLRKKGSQNYEVIQWLNETQDSTSGVLLFRATVAANDSSEYEICWHENAATLQPTPTATTFSRFVPERTDDYAWENDKVAFRTYGPEAQRMVAENIKGGTLSSGIDLWLKRVEYPIIDKWYSENVKQAGYYHIDHGEGHDPYHVGKSRGTGGIGIWENDSLLTSKNFVAYRTIATGPLRTIFELDYADWSAYGVNETKRISLDLGSNFSKFEIALAADTLVPNYTIGITLHEGAGKTTIDKTNGIFGHWEPIDSSYVGEGVIIAPESVQDAFAHHTEAADQSQLLIVAQPTGKLEYYVGFGWAKSKQVNNEQEWLAVLQKQQLQIKNPLIVAVK